MKYLLILLFLFSTQSFSGELDGKGIDCELTKMEPPIFKGKSMWWFNNGYQEYVDVWETSFDRNMTDENGLARQPKSSYYPKKYSVPLYEYVTTPDEVIWYYGGRIITLNRKNLNIKVENHYKDEIPLIEWEGTCIAFTGFSNVVKRQDEMIEKLKQDKLKRKQQEEKAREGNKI
jgi:hypothetical protein